MFRVPPFLRNSEGTTSVSVIAQTLREFQEVRNETEK